MLAGVLKLKQQSRSNYTYSLIKLLVSRIHFEANSEMSLSFLKISIIVKLPSIL